MEYLNHTNRTIKHALSLPFLAFMIVPIVFLDIAFHIYQQTTFYLWGLDYIDRKKYIKIDRHKLAYLNLLDKISCVYCGYANGLLAYVSAIAAQTELYWCGIKHEKDPEFTEPDHHSKFVKYNDNKAFSDKYKKYITRR